MSYDYYYSQKMEKMDLKFSVTGHSSGIGKAIFERFNCKGFSRSNGYDISESESRKRIISESKDCDIFINNAFCDFSQVDYLYDLDFALDRKTIVNISSNTGDGTKNYIHKYAAAKTALDKASEQLFYLNKNKIINLRPGFVDTPRVREFDQPKLDMNEVIESLCFTLLSGFSVREITFIKTSGGGKN